MTTTPSDEEARMAYFEKDENFRWIANKLAQVCPTPLSELVDEDTQQAVYAFAEFAEIAHGSMNPKWILTEENRLLLGQSGFPLEKYPTLAGQMKNEQGQTPKLVEEIQLVKVFQGEKGSLQGYCALRMTPQTPAYPGPKPAKIRPQLILAFSGTSNLRLAMYDMQTSRTAYRTDYEPGDRAWLVHTGFQTVYQGIRSEAFKAVNEALDILKNEPFDFVITAHSLGAAVSYLTLIDILRASQNKDSQSKCRVPEIRDSTNITLALFGAPRVGNKAFVEYYRKLLEERKTRTRRKEAVTEWSVIGHLDGVPALPPTYFGYQHFSKSPFYSYGGLLFSIPPEWSEFTRFEVTCDGQKLNYLRGGHNYYGGRDMERLQRRIKAIQLDLLPKEQRRTLTYRNMSKKRNSTTSDLPHTTGSAHAKPTRGLSMPMSQHSNPDQIHSSWLGRSISEEPEDNIESPAQPASSSAKTPLWVARYKEREEVEEKVWKKFREEKKNPKGRWPFFS